MSRQKPYKIIIVGGSMSGLFAALLMRKRGYEVAVYERSRADLEGRGAGIVTHPELFAILDRAGINITPHELGVAVEGRRVLDVRGRILVETSYPQVLTSWGKLYAQLKSALPPEIIHGRATLEKVECKKDSVTAFFADGREATGDLLIGADGLYSSVRQQLLPDIEPVYAGYIAWRGLVEEADLSQETLAAICNHFSFCLPTGEQMLGYPVAGMGETLVRGKRRFNFVWYRPADPDHLRDMLTDKEGKTHPLSIAPNAIRAEILSAMRTDAQSLLAPAFAQAVLQTREPFVQSIVDLKVQTMCPDKRVALIGDAAFVARPHVGAGVTKAAADANALASALANSSSIDEALRHFNEERRALNCAIVDHARKLGAYMQAQQLSAQERAFAEAHRKPEAVIRETAVPFQLAYASL